jgi:hypothetical protein
MTVVIDEPSEETQRLVTRDERFAHLAPVKAMNIDLTKMTAQQLTELAAAARKLQAEQNAAEKAARKAALTAEGRSSLAQNTNARNLAACHYNNRPVKAKHGERFTCHCGIVRSLDGNAKKLSKAVAAAGHARMPWHEAGKNAAENAYDAIGSKDAPLAPFYKVLSKAEHDEHDGIDSKVRETHEERLKKAAAQLQASAKADKKLAEAAYLAENGVDADLYRKAIAARIDKRTSEQRDIIARAKPLIEAYKAANA